MRYRVETEKRGQRTIYHLHDDQTNSRASILPSYGFNLYDLQLPVQGKPTPILATAADFPDKPQSPGGNGTPILFPFPNRIRAGKYAFDGKSYELPLNLKPNAIHGFALDAPWDVVESKATAEGATVEGLYQLSRHSPQAMDLWPADAILQVRYTLTGRQLAMDISVTNPSATKLPYGFGIHPYFHLPFTAAGEKPRTQVTLPVDKIWVLEEFLPTGEIAPIPARLDFRKGQAMEGLKLDDVFTGLEFREGRCTCRLTDEIARGEFRLSFGKGFRELVAYTPPGNGRVISLEPYTQTTDAINLAAKEIDGGLRILEHGQRETFQITMETVDL